MKLFKYLIAALFLIHQCNIQGSPSMAVTPSGQDLTMEWLNWKGNPEKAKIVLISGDEEYRSEETLVQLAKILNVNHGFNCTVLFAQNPNYPGIVNPNYQNNIPGLVSLADADLMIILTRFRALPDVQMRYIDDYLKSGKPVLGMRTATHAFKFDMGPIKSSYAHYGNYYKENNVWQGGFGKLILGEKWIAHHGAHGQQSTWVSFRRHLGIILFLRGYCPVRFGGQPMFMLLDCRWLTMHFRYYLDKLLSEMAPMIS